LTRKLVELHGGQIAVESDGIKGRGSMFTVLLPLAPPESQPVS
jgi:signal transduction histidine kinase